MANKAVNTYIGGINRDIAKNKFQSKQIYDALNVRLITDKGLSTGNITNERGNKLSFHFPTLISSVYRLLLYGGSEDNNILIINGKACNINHVIQTNEQFYNFLVGQYSTEIAAGHFKIFNNIDTVLIVGLNVHLGVHLSNGSRINVNEETHEQGMPIYVGSCTLRNQVIIFTVGQGINGVHRGQIWKVTINPITGQPSNLLADTLVPSVHIVYHGILKWDINHRIFARGNYETPTIQKIYFSDNLNNFRHLNIADPNSLGIPINQLSIVPDVTFPNINVLEMFSGGTYKAGMVQYSYCYYNLHGAQSTYAPVSGLVHLTKYSEGLPLSNQYYGTAEGESCYKAIHLQIANLDKRFSHIKVVSLHYTSKDAVPNINIVYENFVSPYGLIDFVDSGDSLGTVTLSEFTTLGATNFRCKTFEIKDRMMFAANVTQELYDVDYDARAYRFRLATIGQEKALIKSNDGNDILVDRNFKNSATGLDIPETHDCIQTKQMQYMPFTYVNGSPIANDDAYYYNLSRETGGEGPNVKYALRTRPIVISDLGKADTKNLYVSQQYTNTANPVIQMDMTGYMRDEIYRFGVVFRDIRGRKSFVKWIADIKMPSIAEKVDLTTISYRTFYHGLSTDLADDKIRAEVLYVDFTLKHMPADAVSWEIVRAPREEWDKTILAQGIWQSAHGINKTDLGNIYVPSVSIDGVSSCTLGFIHSPEVSFFKNMKYEAGLQVKIIADVDAVNHPDADMYGIGYTNFDGIHRVRKVVDQFDVDCPAIGINDGRMVSCSSTNKNIVAGLFFVDYCWDLADTTLANGYGPTTFVFSMDAAINSFYGANIGNPRMINIARDFHIPYGGNTYTARTFCSYISCMQPMSVSIANANVFGGDTFVEYFDVIHAANDPGITEQTQHFSTFLMFPVETTICLPLRHDKAFHNLLNVGVHYENLHETAGLWGRSDNGHGTNCQFLQTFDAYLYNTAYSKNNDITKYLPKPLNFSDNLIFDSRIIAALPKTNNEEIDSWTRFLPNTFIDVDGSMGPINALALFEDRMLFLQDRALGVASINEKVLTAPDATGTSLTIGKGGILDDYAYITKRSGAVHQHSVIVSGITKDALYYYDALNNNIMLYNVSGKTYARNETSPLSILKGIQSDLDNYQTEGLLQDSVLTCNGVHATRDSENKRIIFTFLSTSPQAHNFTVSFNEILQCFESFYSYVPYWYQNIDNILISGSPEGSAYVHNKGRYGEFYGKTYDSYFSPLVNWNPGVSKIFSNLEFNLFVQDTNGNDIWDRIFNYVRVYNDYQDTGDRALINEVNCNRRFRVWRVTLPRVSPQVLDRIRGQYAIIKLTFKNDNNERFVMEDLTTIMIAKPV